MSASVAETLREKIKSRRARTGVVGLGYVGLPLAVELGKAGFHATGIDLDPRKVQSITDGRSYIPDVQTADVQALRAKGLLDATTDFSIVRDLDTINICVPTPLRKTKDPDMSYIVSAVEGIAKYLHPGMLIVLESTTYPGTTDEVVQPMLEETGLAADVDFFLAFSPERVDPGNQQFTTKNIPKIVGGVGPNSTEVACALYSATVQHVVPVSSTRVAEMVKLLENTFRAVNIGLVNEIALMCHKMDIDVWEVIDAAKTKPFGFMPFYPGPGIGGHCLPIDPSYLSWQVQRRLGLACRFVHLANDVNDHMPDYMVRRIVLELNELQQSVNGARLLLLGIAYKKNSGDYRESPATRIAQLLVDLGADVRMADPMVDSCVQVPGTRVEAIDEEIEAADLVVVLTDHDAFDWVRINSTAPHVFDTRHRLTGAHIAHL